MTNRKKMSAVVALLLMVAPVVTACNNSQSTKSGNSQSTKSGNGSSSLSPETITVFSQLSNYAGMQTGWFANLIKKKFNIKLNIIASNVSGGSGKFATMMASGNLGDLVVFGANGKQYKQAIKAGLLLDWNKNGLLKKYGQNILKYAPKAIKANEEEFGGGKRVYGVGYGVGSGKGPSEGATMTFGPDLRWDLYTKLGRPKIKTLMGYLPVLKKMQAMDPKTASGKPVYGISLWSDWDTDWMTLAKVNAQLHGYAETDNYNPGDMELVSATKKKTQSFLDPNGYYMQALEFYFKANQMGLLDPDSLTQKFSNVSTKYKNGQVLFSLFPWLDNAYNTTNHTSKGKGFALVPFQNEKIYSAGFNPYGGSRVWAIGAKAKDPVRIMKFLNWLYSPEGIMESTNGPQGLTWDLQNGKPELTAYGRKALPANTTPVPAKYGGGNFKDGINQINNTTIITSMKDPQTGVPYSYHLWPSTLKHKPNPVVKSWRKTMGALTPTDYFKQHPSMMEVNHPVFFPHPAASEPPQIQQAHSQAGKIIENYSWKMIFAKNKQQFNKLEKEMIRKADGVGYQKVYNWEVKQTKKTVFTKRK